MEKRPRYIPEEEAKTPNEDAEQGAVADSGVSSTTSPESLKPRRNSKRWYSRLGKNLLELLPVEIEIRQENSNVSILEPSQPQESRDHTERERHETMATVSNDVSETSTETSMGSISSYADLGGIEDIDDSLLQIPRGNYEYEIGTSTARIADILYPVQPLAMRRAKAIHNYQRQQMREAIRRQRQQMREAEMKKKTDDPSVE